MGALDQMMTSYN